MSCQSTMLSCVFSHFDIAVGVSISQLVNNYLVDVLWMSRDTSLQIRVIQWLLVNIGCLSIWKYCSISLNQFKGLSINVNIFTSVQTIQFHGELGSVKINIFPYTFNILAWFSLFSREFLALKKCWCVLFYLGGGASESVLFVYSWKCSHLWMPLRWNSFNNFITQ